MTQKTAGIHHITAFAGDPQANVDFYSGILGLRLVKVTVNFDAPDVYHFYFGDETGKPGTAMTFFPFRDARRGQVGGGQVALHDVRRTCRHAGLLGKAAGEVRRRLSAYRAIRRNVFAVHRLRRAAAGARRPGRRARTARGLSAASRPTRLSKASAVRCCTASHRARRWTCSKTCLGLRWSVTVKTASTCGCGRTAISVKLST